MKTNYSALEHIKSDLLRYGKVPSYFNIFKELVFGNHSFKFSFWMRMCKKKNVFFLISKFMYSYYTNKYGLQIPYTAQIGYGLYLGHGINIVVSDSVVIGNNCNLSHFCTRGSNYNNAAKIGNNVYIGPNSCIIENVTIGDNVTIGAGSVVVKDIPNDATVAGVPAKLLSYNEPARFIKNPY